MFIFYSYEIKRQNINEIKNINKIQQLYVNNDYPACLITCVVDSRVMSLAVGATTDGVLGSVLVRLVTGSRRRHARTRFRLASVVPLPRVVMWRESACWARHFTLALRAAQVAVQAVDRIVEILDRRDVLFVDRQTCT